MPEKKKTKRRPGQYAVYLQGDELTKVEAQARALKVPVGEMIRVIIRRYRAMNSGPAPTGYVRVAAFAKDAAKPVTVDVLTLLADKYGMDVADVVRVVDEIEQGED